MADVLVFDYIDLIVRLLLVVLFIQISNLLRITDADVIRSRLFLQFEKIKRFFNLLTIGGIFFLAAALLNMAELLNLVDASLDVVQGLFITIFQALTLLLLYYIYDALKSPRRGVL
ncbi:MAG: hypothetical protein M8350_06665 [Methanosarcinaceae archaeon]|nr:hypothetical protein [Methanosarcinaceae archaeon]